MNVPTPRHINVLEPRPREFVHIWCAIGLALLIAVYRFAVGIADLQGVLPDARIMQTVEWITNSLFFVLLGLLWLAYRRWRQALVRQRELEMVVSSISPEVLMVVNPDRVITMCNTAVHDMFGYEVREVLNEQTDLLYFDRRVQGRKHEIFMQLENVGFHVGGATGRRKNGETFPIEIVTGRLRCEKGVVVLIRDITERRRWEDQVLRAKEEAEAANHKTTEVYEELRKNFARLKELEETRDNLTRMIVHDLKSPLTVIHAYLELLRKSAAARLESREIGYLDEGMKTVWQLAEMISALLDVGRLESKEMPLHVDEHDVVLIAGGVVDKFRSGAETRTIDLDAPAGAAPANCDRSIVNRVISNLVSNAVKFTNERGSIRIRVEPLGSQVKVSVIDNGLGIAPEHQQRVFDRFFQVQERSGSTGLGLTFCKLAVEAHGGTIAVESPVAAWKAERPGVVGTAFTFTLPAEAGQGS